MATIVNNDKLKLIITSYGLQRIAEALSDTTVEIELSKIKVGDANGEYYVPSADQTALHNPIEGGEFYIIKKELLSDNRTVSLQAIIPESFGGYDIREVGLYENVGGTEYLFAVATQQPFVKPSTSDNYYISVNYYLFLKATNLQNIYDQIVLNPLDQAVLEEDVQELLSTMLFTQGNLSVQIGDNSQFIGYNKATEVYSSVVNSRNTYGYMAACNSYASFVDAVGNDKVFGYWIFDYPKRNSAYKSIVDISYNGYNLSTTQPISTFDQNYVGICSTLKVTPPYYFYLDAGTPLIMTKGAGSDLVYYDVVGTPTISDNGIASDFSATSYLKSKATVDCTKTFEVTFNEQRGSATKFNGFMLARTGNDALPLFFVQSANTSNITFGVMTNGNLNLTEINNFTHANYTSINYIVSWNGSVYSLEIEDALTKETVATLTYNSTQALKNTVSTGVIIYGRNFNSGFSIQATDLRQSSAYNDGQLLFLGSDVGIIDESFTMAFIVEPLNIDSDRTLLARSNSAMQANTFEITETSSATLRVRLFTNSSNYLTFESIEDVIPDEVHAVVISYNRVEHEVSAYINGKKVEMTKTMTGTYTYMFSAATTLYAFKYTPISTVYSNSSSTPTELYNADGSHYSGTEWTVGQNQVYYNMIPATYTESANTNTPTLYAWNYNDGLYDHVIYTKTTTLAEDTLLYNSDYTEYVGPDFSVTLVDSVYIIQYESYTTTYTPAMNIVSVPLYAWTYANPVEKIWANDSSSPTVLFNNDGSIYVPEDPDNPKWTIDNGQVQYYGNDAIYSSPDNIAVSKLDTTPYVTNSSGEIVNPINSNVGLVAIALAQMAEEDMRIFSLELGAQIGSSPCISVS